MGQSVRSILTGPTDQPAIGLASRNRRERNLRKKGTANCNSQTFVVYWCEWMSIWICDVHGGSSRSVVLINWSAARMKWNEMNREESCRRKDRQNASLLSKGRIPSSCTDFFISCHLGKVKKRKFLAASCLSTNWQNVNFVPHIRYPTLPKKGKGWKE